MPASENTLAGIRDNGLRWKYEIRLRSTLAPLVDAPGDDLTEDQLRDIQDRTVRIVKAFVDRIGEETDAGDDISRQIDDFEMLGPELYEIRYGLNDLYDKFDYWRVCVV